MYDRKGNHIRCAELSKYIISHLQILCNERFPFIYTRFPGAVRM